MLGLGAATRIYVATCNTDMRLSFHGLHSIGCRYAATKPTVWSSVSVCNKRRDRMKIFFFDANSLWVCARRMEQGRLHWPASAEGRVQLTREEFALLIGGIDLAATRRRNWYRSPLVE